MGYLYGTLISTAMGGSFYAGYKYGSYVAGKVMRAANIAADQIKKL